MGAKDLTVLLEHRCRPDYATNNEKAKHFLFHLSFAKENFSHEY